MDIAGLIVHDGRGDEDHQVGVLAAAEVAVKSHPISGIYPRKGTLRTSLVSTELSSRP